MKFLESIQQLVLKHNVPPKLKLLVNWDQTACTYIQCDDWTMNGSGAKNIPLTGLDDKREITALFAAAADGSLLPPQLIYGGKNDHSHPHCQDVEFPGDWNITRNEHHWSNEVTMLEYLEKVIKPYQQ